jgi:hypothetical protein
MASNNTVPVLPNPFTPLAFLPPVLADQFEVSCFVVVAGLAVSTQLKYRPQLTLSWLCRLMCGTASCLCRKSIKSSAKVDLLCQASLISCHGQFNVRKFHQALTLLCSIGTLGFTVRQSLIAKLFYTSSESSLCWQCWPLQCYFSTVCGPSMATRY